MALRIDGYVIVSADGMLADAQNVMPHELKFEGDKRFFSRRSTAPTSSCTAAIPMRTSPTRRGGSGSS